MNPQSLRFIIFLFLIFLAYIILEFISLKYNFIFSLRRYLLKHLKILISIKDEPLQVPFNNHLGFSDTRYHLSATLTRKINQIVTTKRLINHAPKLLRFLGKLLEIYK
jgi:hypothetical protein